MKILMIGNGFDLEHGLPTKYTDFLDYIITFRGYYARVYQGQVKPRCDADKGDYFEKLFSDKKNHYKVEALQAMTKDNLWIDYFIKVREQHLKNKENWIDFESEISRIVQDLDEFQKIAGSSSRTEEYYHYKEKLREILEQEDLTPEAIPKTIDKLMLELNKLICALEIYLDDYVGGKEIILYNPDIAQIHPDNVISFNYTDTFRKVYGEYDTNTLPSFVHGMATDHTDRFRVRLRKKGDKNANRVERIIEKNNMVLGIDEYLPEDRRAAEIDFIEFKKFYQRIYKGTGNEYKKWLLANEPKMLYIFGHSLDVTDGDLLREFLERDDVKTVVFYLDNKQRRQLITNLVKILGEDAVIEKTYGNNPSIVFQKQSPAEKIENSKFDLLRDIGRVRRLCEMPEASARVLLDKIDTKINDRDLEYFGTQVEVIDLFDALQRIGLGERYKDDLYHIAVSLVEEVGCEPKQFNEEDWSCGEYDGSFGPDADTAAFIKEINSFNWIYQNVHEQEHTDEEDDIFSKYEYLFHSDGEVREPTFKRVWEDFRKACSEGAYSQKKLWDFMRSIVLGPAQNIAYGTIRKFRQETDDPIEIVQLTELMYEVEANEYMESVAENLHNKLD